MELAHLKTIAADLSVRFIRHRRVERTVQFLGVYRFETLPVPVSAIERAEVRPASKRSLVVGYLGDARDEKASSIFQVGRIIPSLSWRDALSTFPLPG